MGDSQAQLMTRIILEALGKYKFPDENLQRGRQNPPRGHQVTLLISSGEWGKDGEKNGKGCEGTCIKDTWTNPKVGRIEGGRWAWVGWGRGVGRK